MIKLHVVTLIELYAHPTNTRVCDIFSHCFRFNAFSTVHTNTICIRFRVDPLLITFSNRCIFAQRIFVDGRSKRIEMYAFSHENALVWTRGLRKSGSIDP